jgi:nucleotide-binding universal stress UspA family protein
VVDTVSIKLSVEKSKAKAKSNIESILNKFYRSALIYIEEGNPSEKIIEKAKTIEADLIVLGNNSGKGKLPGRVVKNVTRNMKNAVIIV